MGMFDYVEFECICPVCHTKVTGFQSKSGECMLDTVLPNEVANFYSYCEKCGCNIDYTTTEKPFYRQFERRVEGKWDGEKKERPRISKHDQRVII